MFLFIYVIIDIMGSLNEPRLPPHISFPPMLVFEINNLQEKADLGLLIGIFDDSKFFGAIA